MKRRFKGAGGRVAERRATCRARPRPAAGATRPTAGRRADGFTLVELLVALAVLSILLSVAAPSFRGLVADLEQSTRYNRLASDLRLARSEAIKRSGSVRLCARADGDAGSPSCGDDWTRGWHVFVEGSGGTPGAIDGGEALLRSRAFGTEEGPAIVARALVRPAPIATVPGIAFDSRGRADWTLGTIVLCDGRGDAEALALVVNGAGGFRRAEPLDGTSDVVADALGEPVECGT